MWISSDLVTIEIRVPIMGLRFLDGQYYQGRGLRVTTRIMLTGKNSVVGPLWEALLTDQGRGLVIVASSGQIVFRTGGMSNLAHAVAKPVAELPVSPGRVA